VKNLLGGVGNLSEGAQKDIKPFGMCRENCSKNVANFSADGANFLEGARKGVELVRRCGEPFGKGVESFGGCSEPFGKIGRLFRQV
jgi:hypothetical protein